MTSLLLSDLITHVRNLLSDNVNSIGMAPDSVVGQSYSDDIITDGVNQAIREYCIAKPHATYTETTPAIPTGGLITLPNDYLIITCVNYGGSFLVKSTREFEEMANPGFEASSATAMVKRWWTKDGNTVALAPVQTTWNQNAFVGYIQMPALLVASAPSTPIDSRIQYHHQEYLKYGAACYLCEMSSDKQDFNMAAILRNQFMALIGAK
jgi:hypothetical protein